MSQHNARNRTNGRNKKIAVVAVVAGLVLGGSGAAFAYWTSTGTGAGTATTGESTDFIVTSSDPTEDPLTPGGPSQTVEFNVENPSTGAQELSNVTVTVANADGSPWFVTGCSAADYTVTSLIAYGVIDGGDDVDGLATVSMIDRPLNQDGCQGVDVPLYFSAS